MISYLHIAAVAEMPIVDEFLKARFLSVEFLMTGRTFTSRTAVYAIRMYGAVGGALSDERPYPYVCRARHMFLKVSQGYHKVTALPSLRSSRMEAKDVAVDNGVPVTVFRKAVTLPRQGTAKIRDDVQKSSQACIVGRACNTR